MTEDLTRGFADETTQHEVAPEPSAVGTTASETSTETNLTLAGDAELAGAEGTETLSGQVRIEVGKPVAGETLVIEAQAGETYVLDFPADEARAFAEGDDLILAFEDGSRIVFEGLVNLAQLENGPRLEYGGEDLMPLLIAQGIIPGVLGTFELTEPQPGETIVISAAEGQVYGVQFDPSAVQILVDDNDLILVFANGGRIIIENLGAFADSPNAPVFDIAGTEVPGPTLYSQAVALGEEAAPPTFATVETAATGEPQGTGETRYSDDFGDTIPLIDPQGVIPPVFLEFGLINPEPAEIINIEDEPPQADPVLTPAERGQDGENIPEALSSALSQLDGGNIDPSSVAFFKEFTVDGVIGDDDDPQADFGGADLETALGDLTFTLLSDPTYGTLVLITSGGDVSELNVGDTFTSEDTVWWIATENQVSAFLEDNPDLNGILPDVEFNYMVTDEAGNTATAPVTITVDDAPSIGDPDPAILDEDGQGGIAGLPGSIPGGPGDDVPPEPKGVIFSGNLDYDFGGDGAGDVSFADLDGDPVVDQALTPVTSAGATLTWEWDAATHTLTAINDDTQQPVLTLQVTNVDTGDYTVTLLAQLDHPATDADGNNDGPETAWEDEIVFDLPFVVSDVDGDTAEGSVLVTVDDDSPIESGQTESETVEEDDLNNAQSVGNNEDLSVNAHIATGSIAGLVLDGADEDATFGVAAVTSGLPALLSKGESVVYDVTGDTLTAYVESGDAGGLDGADRVVFTLQVQSNGDYTFTLVDQLDHEDDGNDDENTVLQLDGGGTVGSIDFSSVIEATDFDGDTITLTEDAFTITVEDDIPIVLASTDLIYSNANNGDGGGTGVFDYSIGADERNNFSALNSDFSAITLSGTVGGVAISSPTVTWASEDLTMAEFDISFFYAPNPDAPGETVEATGTLTFDKVNGTYTVVLDEPIESFTVLTTSDALGFQGYELGSANEDNSGPADVVVAQLSNDFFVQFTGIVEPGGGTGSDNLFTVGDGSPGDFADGDLFSQNPTSVTVSSVAAGVAGNTIQKGEVLDMDFFTFDPQGFNALDPDARVTDVFFKFDGIGSEDLVIVLKLVSRDGLTTTTKAIIVDNEDILTLGDPIPSGFGITLDNNDGVVIIESNDYNFGSEDWVIEGAQVLVSVEGITGEGIDLNGATGDSGGSSETLVAFDAGDTDNDVIKITDIGFVTAETDTEDADLTFDFSLVDADGDETAPQSLDVTIEGGTMLIGTDTAESIEGDAGMETLIGNGGDDILTGGSDADTFVFSLAVNEGHDDITDFDFSDGDVLSFIDVVDVEPDADIDVDDVIASYTDGGAPGTVDTITLTSGTVISVTDIDDAFSSAADVFNNSLINGV